MKFLSRKKYPLAFLTAFGLLLVLINYAEPAYRTGYIISQVVPNAPNWFEWGKYDVSVEKVELDVSNNNNHGRSSEVQRGLIYIYLPMGVIRPGFVILLPGFTPDGALDARLVNLARSFAGAGIGVAVPDSSTIRKRIFSRDDIELIKLTFYFLQDQDYVDKERIGICGFSVAGSYALRAASELGSGPLFVLSLGGYFDLGELIAQVISKSAIYNRSTRLWKPNPMPEEVISNNFIRHIGVESIKQINQESLSFEDAKKYIQMLPEAVLINLSALSPSPTLPAIKTRVFLIHDKNDDVIPVEDSYKIRDLLPRDIPVHLTELSSFDHVTPENFFSLDTLKLSWQVLNIVKMLI
ncbi:MAG TPA: hypothetical protein VNN20_11290 [Thermodesulfobacteriota bacterium]|nr:hypothetical protein [Thermodesulfobacteriota bacterium]